MGCGSSQTSSEVHPSQSPRPFPTTNNNNNHAESGRIGNNKRPDSPIPRSPRTKSLPNGPQKSDSPRRDVPKMTPVAFSIDLDEKGNKQGLIAKHPPKRLQLEPLNLPKLTADMLAEKQELADRKRAKVIDEKISVSQRSSRIRGDILKSQQIHRNSITEKIHEMEDQQKNADELRESRQHDIREKQRLREERAIRVREKAKKIKGEEDAMVNEMEKDQEYNLKDDDSWDNDDVESGYASPQKGLRPAHETREVNSASTVDSFDNAFNRMRFKRTHVEIVAADKENMSPSQNAADSFFDT